MRDFLDNGYLTPGIHSYTISNFEKQFIDHFPSSRTRKKLYINFKKWLRKVSKIQTPRFIWLDGSYITEKSNPNDIDLVIFYRPEQIKSEKEAQKINILVHHTSRAYGCDAYVAFDLEHLPQDVANQHYHPQSIMVKYWMGQFAFDRNQNPKGMVKLGQEEIIKCIGGVVDDKTT